MTAPVWPDDDVILFDGVCVFCSRWVRFIVARDVSARFRFTPIQSAYGTRMAQALCIEPDDPDTNAVVHGGIGMTMEAKIGHYFKRLTMIENSFGDTDYHLRRVTDSGGLV